jgi:hypothetical protein
MVRYMQPPPLKAEPDPEPKPYSVNKYETSDDPGDFYNDDY